MDSNEILKKRINELSQRAYQRGYNTFTDFLNMDEISTLVTTHRDNDYRLFGGYENAERCIAGFGSDIADSEYNIVCIAVEPLQQKFADKLTHRDFLGALMNLGINRNTLGDIIVKDNCGYLFCQESISEYIMNSLDRIKHTSVKCSILDDTPEFLIATPEDTEIIASSNRVDIIVAAVYKLSRNAVTQLVNQEKVFINSRVAYKESLVLKDGDKVSVRGYGKFVYNGMLRQTKKGKNIIQVQIYK